MVRVRSNQEPILLRACDGGTVHVEPADNSRFIIAVSELVEACRSWTKRTDWEQQFSDLLDFLGKWVQENASDVIAAHVSTREDSLLFIAIHQEPGFNQGLTDRLADLEIEVANRGEFHLLRLATIALPASANLQTFVGTKPIFTYAQPK